MPDSVAFMPKVKRLREQFGIQRMVMVANQVVQRGMISQKAIDAMSEMSEMSEMGEMGQDGDLAWLNVLRSASIRTLVQQGHLQMGLFDERNLLEISSPDFPGGSCKASCRMKVLIQVAFL